jgi:hypothetical protein
LDSIIAVVAQPPVVVAQLWSVKPQDTAFTMHPFTQRLAERIEQSQRDVIADSLVDAGEIMRMWHFFGGDPSGSAVVGPFSEQTE